MMDSYFNQMDRMIQPTAHAMPKISRPKSKSPGKAIKNTVTSTLSNNQFNSGSLENKQTRDNDNYCPSQGFNTNTLSNAYGSPAPDDVRTLFVNERKKNMELRYEVSQAKKQINSLQEQIREKDDVIEKMKLESEKDRSYLFSLENMITDLREKLKKSKGLSNKSSKALINTVGNSSETQRTGKIKSINLICDPDPISNEVLKDQYIENLKADVYPPDVNIEELKKELENLRKFKDGIFDISKENDNMNGEYLELLKKLEELCFKIQNVYKELSTDVPIEMQNFYKPKYETLNEIKNTYDTLMAKVTNNMQSKQAEYAFMLQSKDDEIDLLMKEIERLKIEKKEIYNSFEEKNKMIDMLRQENEFVKMRDVARYDQLKTEENLREKQRRKNKIENGYKNKVSTVKNSTQRSLNVINTQLDLNDEGNQKLVKNINSYMKA